MIIYYNKLENQLKDKSIQKHVVSSQDNFLENKVVRFLNKKAINQGFAAKETIYIDKDTNLEELHYIFENQSLFEERKVIIIRLLCSLEKKIKDFLQSILQSNVLNDKFIIIILPELKSNEIKSKWLNSASNDMTLIRIFKPNEKDIYNELYTYQKECGLNLDSKFLKYICDKNSNNLFSAAQIIEKLSLIDEIDININDQNLNKLFSSDSQYSSFLLFDYCIKADYVNILNSINFLKSNKISISVIIWVFIRKFHEYTRHINKIEQGASIDEIVKNIWPYEQKEITRMALSKFSIKMIEMYISMFIRLDMQSKNLVKGDTWLSLKDLCIAISKNKLSILKLN
tara:strand:+ start:7556 stop:8584 length:1029 start_codon:yes stop_codon:yes gene_type:complete